MSHNEASTIEDLLADSLVQTVMLADRVEPQALRMLLTGVSERIAAARRQPEWKREVLPARAPERRRTTVWRPSRPRSHDGGSTLCC
jgi:hypothetical protein